MGLDTSHECWHGAYSSFGRWRGWIAEQLGWEFDTGPDGNERDYLYVIPIERIPTRRNNVLPIFAGLMDIMYDGNPYMGDWYEPPEDIIDVLMVHSDCDGRIPARFCRPLAERLSLIVQDAELSIGDDWRPRTNQFIEGLIRAANRNEDVLFQ
jgi:hypothetical protein